MRLVDLGQAFLSLPLRTGSCAIWSEAMSNPPRTSPRAEVYPMPRNPWTPITDQEWARLAAVIPQQPTPRGRGRPLLSDRACLDAFIWSHDTGLPWKALPARLGVRQTVWRRRTRWRRDGTWAELVRLLTRMRGGPFE